MKFVKLNLFVFVLVLLTNISVQSADNIEPANFTRLRDVIYGRKDGMALTKDVFTPADAKGVGVLWIISGSGRSDPAKIDTPRHQQCIRTFLDRGYTVFAVIHSSAPRFSLPDMIADIHRAVRFVRYRADDFGIKADHIGIAGASAGGTLSLLIGTSGQAGDPNDPDPVERQPSNVQAVGSFFAPTDWCNFDNKGNSVIEFQIQQYGFADPSFRFEDFDQKQQVYRPMTDTKQIQKVLTECSPIAHVSRDDAPTMIIHGDADPFVPFHQSQWMVDKLRENDIPAKLILREGKGHGWTNWEKDTELIADWFDKYLYKVN